MTRAGRRSRKPQVQNLSADGSNGNTLALDRQVLRPAARGHNHRVCACSLALEVLHLLLGDGHAALGQRFDQRRHQRTNSNIAVRRHGQRRHDVAQRRLEAAGGVGIEQLVIDPVGGQSRGGRREPPRLLVVERRLEAAGPLILDQLVRIHRDPVDEGVVLVEAGDAEPEQRLGVGFDVRCEDAGRSPGRALAGTTRVDDPHGGAARRELVGDGQADDSCADDRDVHGNILVGSRQCGSASR